LIDAANARFKIKREEDKKGNDDQDSVVKERAKKKMDKLLNPYGDPNLVIGSLDHQISVKYATKEMTKSVVFAADKPLGLSIEANVVNKEGKKGSQAQKLGVAVGWVMGQVNGTMFPREKAGILECMKAATATAKEGDGNITVEFRTKVPNQSPPCTYCVKCNYFRPITEFEEEQLKEDGAFGPGKQSCKKCNGIVDDADY
jgi:hypothetical protein